MKRSKTVEAVLIIGLLIIFIFVIGSVNIDPSLIMVIGLLVIVGGVIAFLSKKNFRETDIIAKSTAYVTKYWEKTYNEKLTLRDSIIQAKVFDNDTFIGFTLQRQDGPRIHQPCNVVVKKTATGFIIFQTKELVTDAFEAFDPFYYFRGSMEGAPVSYPEKRLLERSMFRKQDYSPPTQNIHIDTKKKDDID